MKNDNFKLLKRESKVESIEYIWPEGEEIVYLRPPKEEYHGKLENFYSPQSFPELGILKENWKGIRDEILEYEKKCGLIRGVNSYNLPENTTNAWSNIYLLNYLIKYHKNRKLFPFTTSIIEQIPNCTFCIISVLPAGTEIKPHYDDTNGIIRTQLALIVPAPYPVIAIKIGEDEKGWTEGELMCFPVVNKHEVWNRSEGGRYVLIVDIVPRIHAHRIMEISSKTLGNQTFTFFYNNYKIVRYLPEWINRVMCSLFSICWRLYLPVQRGIKFL